MIPLVKDFETGIAVELQGVETFAGAACFRARLGGTSPKCQISLGLVQRTKAAPLRKLLFAFFSRAH